MKTLYSALFSTLMLLGLIALPFSSSMFGEEHTLSVDKNGVHHEMSPEDSKMDKSEDMDKKSEESKDAKKMDEESSDKKDSQSEDSEMENGY